MRYRHCSARMVLQQHSTNSYCEINKIFIALPCQLGEPSKGTPEKIVILFLQLAKMRGYNSMRLFFLKEKNIAFNRPKCKIHVKITFFVFFGDEGWGRGLVWRFWMKSWLFPIFLTKIEMIVI